jgi:hypothetical protein
VSHTWTPVPAGGSWNPQASPHSNNLFDSDIFDELTFDIEAGAFAWDNVPAGGTWTPAPPPE